MDNFLDNGTVLPHGLLGHSNEAMMAGFNKSYKNSPLRIGVVLASYPVGDSNNRYSLTNEYDVYVIEQNEDKGSTGIRYRNCMSAEGFGSIADYFERTLRFMKQNNNKGSGINLKGQNGAIVLLLCLDAMSDKGIIITSLTHPDRETNLTGTDPYLEGEYNGVNIVIKSDGSCALTWKGATDNDGNVINDQGQTILQIKPDGSFEFNHSTVDISANKNGTLTITTKADCVVNASGGVSVTATKDVAVQCDNANVQASGKASVQAGGIVTINGSETDVQGSTGTVLTNVTDPVVDTIFGEPTKGVPTFKAG